MAILATAMSLFAGTVASVATERGISRESVTAAEAAESFVERLRSENVRLVFARYNTDPSDDPGGAGTAPGARFEVVGLDPGDAPDGLAGEVRFPAVDTGPAGGPPVLELREDTVEPAFGLPRDLNGDSIIDEADHGDDYLLLPFEVVVTWRGRTGLREHRTFATLCEYKWE